MTKKKITSYVKLILAVALALVAMLAITSCKCSDDEHAWDAGVVQTPATCTESGSTLFTCTDCDEQKTEITPALQHANQSFTIEATCSIPGKIVDICSRCNNETIVQELPAGHNYVTTSTTATCKTPGVSRIECTKCGDFTAETVVASHKYVETIVTVSCTRDGAKVYTCSDCGDTYRTVTQRSTGHNTAGCTWTSEDIQIQDCLWQHVEKTTCTDCSTEVTKTEDFEKHDYKVEITRIANCRADGIKIYTCKVDGCGDTKTESYSDATAHNWSTTATPVSTGNSDVTTYTCTIGCGTTKTVYSAKDTTSANVPSDALQSTGEVELKDASLKLDENVLSQLGNNDISLSAGEMNQTDLDLILSKMTDENKAKIENAKIYDFALSTSAGPVKNFDGYITLTIRYDLQDGDDPENIAVWYIDKNGIPQTFSATYTIINGLGYAQFTTNHFSCYTVIRMSATERCAWYGHKYDVTVVPASCNVQGYTLEVCKVCRDVKPTHSFTDALTHNYQTTTVPASCASKGYTSYQCTICQDRYISDYVNELSHDYEQSVVAPTCTEKGYTLMACKNCDYSYYAKEASATGHSYVNGTCTTCGKQIANADKTYLTLLDSMASAESYYLEIKEFSVSATSNDMTVPYIIKNLQAVIGLTDEGYLEGKGEAKAFVEVEGSSYEFDAIVIFANKNIYVYVKAPAGTIADAETTMLVHSKQDYLIEEMFDSDEMTLGSISGMLNGYSSIWESIVNTSNSPLNTALDKILTFVFTKKVNDNGYTYTFNPAMANIIYNTLRDYDVKTTFDKVFGAGKFDEVVSYIKNAPNMTVGELEADVVAEFGRWGISKEIVYSILSMVLEADANEFIESAKDTKIIDFINQGNEEPMTLEAFQQQIDSYVEELNKGTVLKLIFGEEYDSASDPLYNVIQDVINAMGKAEIKFTTNVDNEYVSSSMVFNQFVYSYVEDEISYEVSINGSVKLSANETYLKEYTNIINEISAMEKAFEQDSITTLNNFILCPSGDETYVWLMSLNVFDTESTVITEKQEIGTEAYNGVECTKYSAKITNLYKVFGGYTTGEVDCFGWYRINVELDCNMNTTDAYVWMDADGKLVGIQVIESDEYTFERENSISFYYNPEQNTFSSKALHNYKLADTVMPNGCEYGRYIHECTICGSVKENYFGEGHSYVTTATLDEGSVTCEDGIIVKESCSKCNKVFSTYKTDYHKTTDKSYTIKDKAACGDIIVNYRQCPCGQNQYFNKITGDCIFDDNDYIADDTFACAITNCGYTYTRSYNVNYVYHADREETCWREETTVYNFGNGDFVLTLTNSWASHDLYSSSIQNGTLWSCELCGNKIEEYTYDEHGRTVHYYSYENEYGRDRVYTGCDYVETTTDGDTYTGTNHVTTWTEVGGSCSQYSYNVSKCTLCSYQHDGHYYAPDAWYNDDTHDWRYNSSTNMYICNECGTESATGADALIVLEDMVENGEFKVGYFNKREWDMDSEVTMSIIFNYQQDGSGTELENSEDYLSIQDTTPTDRDGYTYSRDSGIVTVDMDLLNAAIAEAGNVETVSLVFWVLDYTISGEPSWIAHALTFELAELQ